MADRPVLPLSLGDVVRLRRAHPCGADTWTVDRLGADIGLRCSGCGRHVLIERAHLERRLIGFVAQGPGSTDPGPTSPSVRVAAADR